MRSSAPEAAPSFDERVFRRQSSWHLGQPVEISADHFGFGCAVWDALVPPESLQRSVLGFLRTFALTIGSFGPQLLGTPPSSQIGRGGRERGLFIPQLPEKIDLAPTPSAFRRPPLSL